MLLTVILLSVKNWRKYSTEIEAGDSNDLYLDDDIAESDSAAFSSGTLMLLPVICQMIRQNLF